MYAKSLPEMTVRNRFDIWMKMRTQPKVNKNWIIHLRTLRRLLYGVSEKRSWPRSFAGLRDFFLQGRLNCSTPLLAPQISINFSPIRSGVVVALLLIVSPGGAINAEPTMSAAEKAYSLGDYTTAIQGFRFHAERGDTTAQFLLGSAFYAGLGVNRDYIEAAKWFLRAAEQGNVTAQLIVGQMYHEGQGVPQDHSASAKWYRMAAERGHDRAQYLLGKLYYNGRGVRQDYAEAVKWHRKAAERGYDKAQYLLGIIYHEGHGVPRDYVEAVKWLRAAAEQGDADAQYFLGIMYWGGRGVPQDYVHAHMWINLAAARTGTDKSEAYRSARATLEAKMTHSQVSTAQRLAREWQPKTWGQLKRK